MIYARITDPAGYYQGHGVHIPRGQIWAFEDGTDLTGVADVVPGATAADVHDLHSNIVVGATHPAPGEIGP